MTVTHKTGDLLKATEGVIGHGVNCKGVMGAGIAKAIRAAYPAEMFEQYRTASLTRELVPGSVDWYRVCDKSQPDLLNIASQNSPGADARLEWLAEGMLLALPLAKALGGEALAVPRIGCGIGGLTWEAVEAVFITSSIATGVDVVVYTL